MAIRLIAVDMDDTLLDSHLQVSLRNCEAIRQAQEQGIAVAIATGRMHSSALPYAQQLNMQVPIITYNGGMLRHPQTQETLYHQVMDEGVFAGVLALFKEQGWYLQAYVNDQLYVKELDKKARFYEEVAGIQALAVGQDFYQMKDRPTKMLSMGEPEEIQHIQKMVNERFAEGVFTTTSKDIFLELTHPQVNKGHALAMLASHLGVAREEIMAIGDSNNDYPMLEYAGLGVAMGNASERVKKVAQAVTATNDEDGVAKAIERYVLK